MGSGIHAVPRFPGLEARMEPAIVQYFRSGAAYAQSEVSLTRLAMHKAAGASPPRPIDPADALSFAQRLAYVEEFLGVVVERMADVVEHLTPTAEVAP